MQRAFFFKNIEEVKIYSKKNQYIDGVKLKSKIMIKKWHISIVTILMVGLMFSCSTSNDVASNRGIQKRKYNKGFFYEKGPKLGGDSKQTELADNKNTTDEKTIEVEAVSERVSAAPEVVFVETIDGNVAEITTVNETAEVAEEAIRTTPVNTTAQQNLTVEGTEVMIPVQELKKRPVSFLKKAIVKRKLEKLSAENGMNDDAILYYVLAFFIPFLAVGLVTDWDVKQVIINILLCCLCGIPGIIHAFIVVSRNV